MSLWCIYVCPFAYSCPTLCDSMDCSSPDTPVHGIFPTRILGWVAISSSSVPSPPKDQTHISCIARELWATQEAHIFFCMHQIYVSNTFKQFTHIALKRTRKTVQHASNIYAPKDIQNKYIPCAVLLSTKWLHLSLTLWTLWTPLSMEFSRQEYWSGLPLPPPGNLPNPEIKPGSPHCRHTLP